MRSYRSIVGLLPSFIDELDIENKQKFELWDAMNNAYQAGLQDAAEEILASVQFRKNFFDSLSKE